MYLICKLLYIAIFALLSAAPPYLPLYYRDVLDFSSNQIGFVLAIAPFIQSIACPLWSYIVDKKPKLHGPIMALTALLGGSAIMGIMVIGHSVLSQKEIPTTFSFMSYQLSNTVLVGITSSLALAFAFFTLPNISLVDSAVMKILGPDKLLYGEQRLWGSISAGVTILLVGQLLSFTKSYDVVFYVFGTATLFFILFSSFANVNREEVQYVLVPEPSLEPVMSTATGRKLVPVISNRSEKLLDGRVPINTYNSIEGQSHYVELFKPTSIREEADETLDAIGHLDLGLSISRIASVEQLDVTNLPSTANVLKSVRVSTFLVTTLIFGLVLSLIQNFLFLFLSRDLLVPASWIGWTGPTTGITELLCFCFSKQMTEMFGVTKMILIAHVATVIRCLSYTVLQPDSIVTNISALLLQTLHGVGFGIFWATAVSEIDGFFSLEQRAVAQGLLGALHFGLGAGLGALVGGFMYQYLGAVPMFQITAIITSFSMAIFYFGRLERYNK